jgi:hypothetical protein
MLWSAAKLHAMHDESLDSLKVEDVACCATYPHNWPHFLHTIDNIDVYTDIFQDFSESVGIPGVNGPFSTIWGDLSRV